MILQNSTTNEDADRKWLCSSFAQHSNVSINVLKEGLLNTSIWLAVQYQKKNKSDDVLYAFSQLESLKSGPKN